MIWTSNANSEAIDQLYQHSGGSGRPNAISGITKGLAKVADLRRRLAASDASARPGRRTGMGGQHQTGGKAIFDLSSRHDRAGHPGSKRPAPRSALHRAAYGCAVLLVLGGCSNGLTTRDESLVRQAESRLTRMGTQGVMPSSILGLGVLGGQMWDRWSGTAPTRSR